MNIDLRAFASVEDFLKAVGYSLEGDVFIKEQVEIPVIALHGHTPVTFLPLLRMYELYSVTAPHGHLLRVRYT
jgi:hypothetical protein